MKKIATIILALAMALGLCGVFGCTSSSKKPSVSLTVKVPTLAMTCISNPEIEDAEKFMNIAMEKFTASYDKADVTYSIEVFDYVDESDAISGCYDSADAVDVLYEGYFNMAAYVSEGYVVPLDDIITENIRNDISEASWAQSTKNGKVYMMPYLSMQNVLIYNKSLFKECGLEEYMSDEITIQNWTISEWNDILDALAANLPEGAYPLAMYAGNNQGDTHIMCYLRAFGGDLFDENGNFDFETDEVIEALTWIQDGVDKGWYPTHAQNLEMTDNSELFSNNQLAIYITNNTNLALYEDVEEKYGFVNFPGNIATSFITGFEVFDNGDAATVEVAKDFVKFIYEDEELLEISAGSIPESASVSEKYADEIDFLDIFIANADNVIDFMNSSPNWQGSDDSVRNVFWPHIHDLLAGDVTPEECAASLNEDCNAAISVDVSYHE